MDNDQLNKTFADTHRAMLKIEKEWLRSIDAPVTALPSHVVEAVATRVLLSGLPLEYILKFMDDIESGRVLEKAGHDNDNGAINSSLTGLRNKNGHQIINQTGTRHWTTNGNKITTEPDIKPPPVTYHTAITRPVLPAEREISSAGDSSRQSTKEALEYNTAFYIVDFFRRTLADIGYLGLSDDDIFKATEQALKGEISDNDIVMHIQNWLDGELNPFKPSLQKVFGEYPAHPKSAVEDEIKRYTKTELLQKTGEIIQDFHSQLANFGWSGLLYSEVFEATRLALKINFFDEARDKIDDTLQPIAWHIHVLLQEPEYAYLKPILEEGLKSSTKEVLQATANTAKISQISRRNKTVK